MKRIADLPGPRGLPILGNLLQIDTSSLHLIAEKWSRQYGEVFRFRIGRRQLVALANPETIAAVLRERPDGFHRTERMSAIAPHAAPRRRIGAIISSPRSRGCSWRMNAAR